MYSILGVFVGGGLGAVLRWLVGRLIAGHWGVFLVNILGAFFIGLAYAWFARRGVSAGVKLFVMTGLLGGFTTFSTYLLDFIHLSSADRHGEAWAYLAGSVAVGAGALVLGMKCGG